MSLQNELETKTSTEEKDYESLSVILARDLIFMDWTVNFGGQMLGILLAIILGFMFGVNVFSDLFGGNLNINPLSYIMVYLGTTIAVVALCVYYIIKLGININSPKKIAKNKVNIIKIAFFGFAFIFGISYIYSSILQPAVNKIAGIASPFDPDSNGGTNGQVPSIDWKLTNQYVILLAMIILSAAVFAVLYAGIMYSINRKVRTMEGVAVIAATILMMFFLLSQFSMPVYLIEAFKSKSYSLLLPFLNDLLYYMLISFVIIMVYHMSRRIELALIFLFFGFGFGYESSNIFEFLVILKWGFPKDSYISASIIETIQGLQYAGLAGMVLYPLVFYKDTWSFMQKSWKTIKKQGLAILVFFFAVFAIEVIIQFIFSIFQSILLPLIIFIVLVAVVNSFITKRYGAQSYTGLLRAMSQATLQMSETVVPKLKTQTKFLERKLVRKRIIVLSLGTGFPILIYFVVMYLATAITAQTTTGIAVFLYTAVPISLGVIAFAVSFFFVMNPTTRSRFNYQYPLKIAGVLGGIVYFIYVLNALVYNTVGYYPLITLFYIPFIIIPIIRKDKFGSLLLSLAGDNRDIALKELMFRKDINFDTVEERFENTPSFLKMWLALIMTKKGMKTQHTQQLINMLSSEYPIERATGALCLLYQNDEQTLQRLMKLLENDPDPKVRNAIAYGFKYIEEIPEDLYKRIIDSQHYEDDSAVLETLKQTISELDLRFAAKEEEEEIELEELEEYLEEI